MQTAKIHLNLSLLQNRQLERNKSFHSCVFGVDCGMCTVQQLFFNLKKVSGVNGG